MAWSWPRPRSGLVLACPWLWPGPARTGPPSVRCHLVDARQARAVGAGSGLVWPVAWARLPALWSRPRLPPVLAWWGCWPWSGRVCRRLREVAPWWRGPPRGPGRRLDVLALVVDLGDASTIFEAVPLPALPSCSRRRPLPGRRSPGPVPGAPRNPTRPSRPPKGAPVPPPPFACRRPASWSWWTRDKVRIPARMPQPAPGPERRSQAPSRGAEPVPLCPSVCRVAWMDVRMVYSMRCLTHPVSSLDDARAARPTRRRWPHAGDDPNAS